MARLDDPEVIDQMANQLLRQAAAIRDVAGTVRTDAEASSWRSASATRHRSDVAQTTATAEGTADEMEHLASALRREAVSVREELAHLARLEAAVRARLEGRLDAVGRWHPANLPPTGDTTWRVVARDLGVS